ncbi:MAG: hypothetical protein HC811_00825 [Flammeovirgaceae bacterium]|nr:hypothetical protein [Flammeovirgaceae bacterium]
MNVTKGFFFLLGVTFLSCSSDPPNSFSDPRLIQIADFQDRRLSDSLYSFLIDENPIYRRASALAFGSIQDTLASSALGDVLLGDSDEQARINAAFSLGQTGGFEAVNALIPAKEDSSPAVVQEVLEALGKTIGEKETGELTNYQPEDSTTAIGLARGIYRIGLRNIIDSAVSAKAIAYLEPSNPESVRLAIAHYFSRTNAPITHSKEKIIFAALSDPSVDVRMASASALRRLDSASVLTTIKKILESENDYRVRSNAVRSLTALSFQLALPILIEALKDRDVNVRITASEVLRSKSSKGVSLTISPAKFSDGRIRGNLYASLLKVNSSEDLVAEIIDAYQEDENTYNRVHLISALSECGIKSTLEVANWLITELTKSESPVIKTSTASALVRINNQDFFPKEFSSDFATMYKQAIQDGDAATIGIVCSALSNPKNGYKDILVDFQFLKDARSNLNLPKDFEAIEPLDIAIAYFEGKPKPESLRNEFNHPINWDLAKTISSNQLVKIMTSKGEVVIRLLIDESPGSVTNFVDLMSNGYFDGKFVHRVVPNFVIQAGCYRGDGYGSEDYSIRSEFGLRRYSRGSVGMASAGKDTEGTQWFITHSPTPHLDGRYTIFAVVENGMEVVDQIEVGDTILRMEMIN